MTDLFSIDLRPTLLLAMWAGGMVLATAAVVRWKIVGPGFLWTSVGSTFLVGLAAAFRGWWGVVALCALGITALVAKKPQAGFVSLLVAAVGFGAVALESGRPALIATGALALGGVTAEMLLGHWFLVDPRLPRWALKKLDAAGIVGLVLDAGLVGFYGGYGTGNLTLISAFALTSIGSIVLMVGVWFSIKEEGYEGIMAATGLSYLALLTSLAAVALGRVLISLASAV